MKLVRDASENDIRELKMRLNKRREERLLQQDLREVIGIVNSRYNSKGEPKCQASMTR